MDELIQLLLFAAIILFALFGRKKKPQQTQKPRPRPQAPRPRLRTDVPARQAAASEPAAARPARRRGLAEDLFEMLQQHMEAPQPRAAPQLEMAPPPEPVAVEIPESLETLEPAGEESHRRFRERYVEPTSGDVTRERKDKPYEEPAERRRRLELTRKKLQHAFVMKEIIGPPKGMQRMGE